MENPKFNHSIPLTPQQALELNELITEHVYNPQAGKVRLDVEKPRTISPEGEKIGELKNRTIYTPLEAIIYNWTDSYYHEREVSRVERARRPYPKLPDTIEFYEASEVQVIHVLGRHNDGRDDTYRAVLRHPDPIYAAEEEVTFETARQLAQYILQPIMAENAS